MWIFIIFSIFDMYSNTFQFFIFDIIVLFFQNKKYILNILNDILVYIVKYFSVIF